MHDDDQGNGDVGKVGSSQVEACIFDHIMGPACLSGTEEAADSEILQVDDGRLQNLPQRCTI